LNKEAKNMKYFFFNFVKPSEGLQFRTTAIIQLFVGCFDIYGDAFFRTEVLYNIRIEFIIPMKWVRLK